MPRRRAERSSIPLATRAAAILLLIASVITSGVELDYGSSSASSSGYCRYEESDEGSSDAEDEQMDWNYTANFTELCSGMMDPNSSQPIYSFPNNSSDRDGNYSYCK